MAKSGNDFNAVRIALASADQIKTWSYGEVTKPETINYRTLRPEKDGLFCERIFGPTKDWECYCGKYKKIRHKGVICDRCGVEVARAKVRRERMGHINLAAPVAHIWMSKGTPSRLGLILSLSPRNLERVIYFAQYLVTSVDEEMRQVAKEQLEAELKETSERLEIELEEKLDDIGQETENVDANDSTQDKEDEDSGSIDNNSPQLTTDGFDLNALREKLQQQKQDIENEIQDKIDELESLQVGLLLSENRYVELQEKFGELFVASMGAEAVLQMMDNLDLDKKKNNLQGEIRSTSGQRRKKAIKTLRLVESLRKSGNKPEWMVLSVLPVLPPELRPMVQLDGGRFATSDLNDLYRRVINRNNRLRRLIGLQAPEIIIRNEKRMLQESVDALIDNGRRGRPVSGSHNHRLKSLSDLLRGKQGRFRQNLLGKRVDYSGRSVIAVGPNLQLHQCGLPRRMALELFKPFVMNRLVLQGYAHNIKSAKRLAERARPEVWDILEEVVSERPVLLNRAPTLHRLGIQAFQPILVEGGAIQVHPLGCQAFNADFDGDQMAVHVPLSKGAVQEARKVMLSSYNMLSPSSGEPIVAPTLDIAFGCYYLTTVENIPVDQKNVFSSFDDARLAHETGELGLRSPIKVRHQTTEDKTEIIETSVGRIIFNEALPNEMSFRNSEQGKDALKEITAECFSLLGNDATLKALDAIKALGFRYASQSGTTIAINDIGVPIEKDKIIQEAEEKISTLEEQYQDGLIREIEKYTNSVEVWTEANSRLTNVIQDNLHNYGGIYLMAISGAKGNIQQIKQMAGMRGLMSDPKGRIIDRPIKSNFREGLSVLEYFISTHGARKGLADTALRTADSGYLTRRLIDVAQEVTITIEDCETLSGVWVENIPDPELKTPFIDRIKSRTIVNPVPNPETGEIVIDRNESVTEAISIQITELNVEGIMVRSPLTCEADRGICKKCYGTSLSTGNPVMEGEAVGIIAAQSIGEPGTQLTMRTFHTGGIAGSDITSGLPRVEELFEARTPKGESILTEIAGTVEVANLSDGRTITVRSTEEYRDEYQLGTNHKILVSEGDHINIGDQIAEHDKSKDSEENALPTQSGDNLLARVSGTVQITDKGITISWSEEDEREYVIPAASHIIVQDGDLVDAGQALTTGPKNPQQILRIQGRDHVQKYLIDEVQQVYRSQGVAIHEKHIEIIIRQMMRKVRIDTLGDTDLLPGELASRQYYESTNASVLAEGGEPSTASPVLLGITRASLNMESFLAAASFQETTRVLTESAVSGDIDYLRGLKENVIIGRLIPARFDISEEGREHLDLDENDEHAPMGVLATPLANLSEHQDSVGEIPDKELPSL